MSLFSLPRGKLSLPFLAVPTGKDGWVECPCQTVDDFIGVGEVFIRRKGADAFRPALAAGGLLMAYKCLSLCDFFIVQHFFKLCHIRFVLLEDF